MDAKRLPVRSLPLTFALVFLGVVLFAGKTHAQVATSTIVGMGGTGGGGSQQDCGWAEGTVFTATTTGTLWRIGIFSYSGTGSSDPTQFVQLSLAGSNNKPVGPVLSTVTFKRQTALAIQGERDYDATVPILIQAGQKYALVWTQYDALNCGTGGYDQTNPSVTFDSTNFKDIRTTDYGVTWTVTGNYAPKFVLYQNSNANNAVSNLSMTFPINEGRYKTLDELPTRGTCDNNNLTVSQQWIPEDINTSTHPFDPSYQDFIVQGIPCTSTSSWHFDLPLTPPPPRWLIRLNQGNFTIDYHINVDWPDGSAGSFPMPGQIGRDATQCNSPNWSCPELTLFVGDICKAGATAVGISSCYVYNTISFYASSTLNVKPFKYAVQMYDAFHTGISSTTTSSTLPSLELNVGHGTTTFINGAHPLNKDAAIVLTQLRPIESYLIVMGFIIYVIALIWF